MIRRQDGFTLVELIVTMFITVLVFGMTTNIFSALLTQFKQQSKIAETSIEGAVGLEILRRDLEGAGYGLPGTIPSGVSYSEAASSPASTYNDAASNPPRAIMSGNNAAANGSDYLVIKSVSVARSAVSEKSSSMRAAPFNSFNPRTWDFNDTDRVIVLTPVTSGSVQQMALVKDASNNFSTIYNGVTTSPWPPTDTTETRLIYGISASAPRMPFNRADYYIKRSSETPSLCAPNTGVLYKGLLSHADGSLTEMPILDCVADLQVLIRRDADLDGTVEDTTNDISLLSALEIRQQVKEVWVYILSHEGFRDPDYTHPSSTVIVGESAALGRTFDLSATIGAMWQNYRWKVYRLVVKPGNLR